MEKRAMNVKELALTLGVSRKTAYELVNREGFPAIRVGQGRRIVIPIAAFEQWLSETALSGQGVEG